MLRASLIFTFFRGMVLIASGKCTRPEERTGRVVALHPGGRRYRVFRETLVDIPEEGQGGGFFTVEFRFRHFVPHLFTPLVPLFAGMPGFRDKLWLVDDETGDYAGLYRYSTVADAGTYRDSFAQKCIRFLAVQGTYRADVHEAS